MWMSVMEETYRYRYDNGDVIEVVSGEGRPG